MVSIMETIVTFGQERHCFSADIRHTNDEFKSYTAARQGHRANDFSADFPGVRAAVLFFAQ